MHLYLDEIEEEERREVQKLGARNEIYAGYKGETKNRRLT